MFIGTRADDFGNGLENWLVALLVWQSIVAFLNRNFKVLLEPMFHMYQTNVCQSSGLMIHLDKLLNFHPSPMSSPLPWSPDYVNMTLMKSANDYDFILIGFLFGTIMTFLFVLVIMITSMKTDEARSFNWFVVDDSMILVGLDITGLSDS